MDLAEIQAVYYMVAATGVIIAAVFYVLNLRETTRNRRITLTSTLMEPFFSKEEIKDWFEIMSMQWTDFEDFQRKYDSRVNPDNFAKRLSLWNRCDSLGQLYKDGLLDLRTMDTGAGSQIQYIWKRFKPIIEEFRRNGDYPTDRYSDFEYVAGKLAEYNQMKGDVKGRIENVMSAHKWTQ